MTDETEKPAADPMAAARAAKAQKAADKAQAELVAAEKEAAPIVTDQPRRSKRKGIVTAIEVSGPLVKVRVTSQGRDHISTGGDFGFDRWDMWAEIEVPLPTAFSLWKKTWIEPLDREMVVTFDKMKVREMQAEARRTKQFREVLERGVGLDEQYSSDPYGPPPASL